MSAVDFGQRTSVVRSPHGGLSMRLSLRSVLVCVLVVLFAGMVLVLSVGQGEYSVSPARVVQVLLGEGTRAERLAVVEWRMPRALMALVGGAALGVSGAIFQAMTRNPLGSPDVIGFTSGAYAGAVVSILVLRGEGLGTTAGALLGGVATALVVYALAYRRGIHGFRLIIVGIGVSQILAAVTAWLMLKADLDLAVSAAVWGSGSLNGVTWRSLTDVSIAVVVLLPGVVLAGRTLRALALGDDAARALGVPVKWAMLWLTVLGVALSAAVVAYCGLIMFISLAAPQIARRLVAAPGIPLVPTAFVGAALLAVSDWIALHGLGDREVPVGVVTVSLGGGYLIWLLIREARRS